MTPYKKISSEFHNRFVQETKNYQDQNLALSHRIEELDRTFASISRAQEERISKVQSDQKRLEIALENLDKFIKGEVADCFTILDGYKEAINNQNRFVQAALCDLNSQYVRYSEFEKAQGYNVKRLDIVEQEADILDHRVMSQYDILKRHITDSIQASAQNTLKQVPSTEPLKQYMEQKFNDIQVNFTCLKGEVERCKYNIFYGEKKFESIYTILERLKGSK